MPVEEEIAIIFCGVNGLLQNVPLDKVAEFEKSFLQILRAKYQNEVLDILKQGTLNDQVGQILTQVANDVALRFQ